jgi:hypothetical protein
MLGIAAVTLCGAQIARVDDEAGAGASTDADDDDDNNETADETREADLVLPVDVDPRSFGAHRARCSILEMFLNVCVASLIVSGCHSLARVQDEIIGDPLEGAALSVSAYVWRACVHDHCVHRRAAGRYTRRAAAAAAVCWLSTQSRVAPRAYCRCVCGG